MDYGIRGVLSEKWKGACKILFGREIGELEKYGAWLSELNEPIMRRNSAISGKEVSFAVGDYCKGAKFQSYNEAIFGEKFEPLSINEIKDIESIANAVHERITYTGDVILGNSKFVEGSSNITDSFYMFHSTKLGDSQYVAYSTVGRVNEYCFGNNGIGESQFCIRCFETFRDKRCLELWMGQNCSDCYFSHMLNGCSDCFFSFHLRGKQFAIGNLQLSRQKYSAIKSSLLSQMRQKLESDRRLPSLIGLVSEGDIHKEEIQKLISAIPAANGAGYDKTQIERAFEKTSALLLGAQLDGGIDKYSDYLLSHTRKTEKCRSAISGKDVFRADYCNYFLLPKERLVTNEEGRVIGDNLRITEEEAADIRMDNCHMALGKIAFFSTEYEEGANINNIICPTPTQSSNCYRSSPVVYSKSCGYSFWPRSSEHAFGCNALFDSSFCISAHYCAKIRKGFELDTCRDCSNAYFSHNCENMQDAMFCFNAKNMRHAIGNAELPREKFLSAAHGLVQQIHAELTEKGSLAIDIYNIGCAKGKCGK